ncbi:AAA family ATPase [Bacillus velezensis]|uniref:ATP-dependent nuclease n=1 Tax=Bacillus velezensis TaxID=492670 RepID=UPI001303A15A|nr:AAA family ATPase [Bacillus velezensis]QGZ45692.1 AAA family ATPase [Bacillus velezensis]
MIVGLMLRNYKCYKNINYISLLKDIRHPYTILTGDNGVGKSAILEALDSLFNGRGWNVNNSISEKDDTRTPFICPLFLIKKTKVKLKEENKNILEYISDYFWDVNWSKNQDAFNIISNDIEEYRDYQNDYYLIFIGEKLNSKDALLTTTYNEEIQKNLMKEFGLEQNKIRKSLSSLKKYIFEMYSYIYIPVEQPVSELLKLETREMQALLDKDILDFIENIIEKNDIVKNINDKLEDFMNEVNVNLEKLGMNYVYDYKSKAKYRLTSKDIKEQILFAYFNLRALKVENKTLDKLSSGEQRQALINTAYAFLKNSNNSSNERDKEIILAIDEPEVSLHVSKSFEQFLKLEEILDNSSAQLLVTTHWSGFIPLSSKGELKYLLKEKDTISITSNDLGEILSDSRNIPDIIELKSMFDLAISLISFMRENPSVNWIFTEGKSDEIYLKYILKDENDIRIISLGGRDKVLKLYNIIYSTISDRKEKNEIKNKLLFLVDTDLEFKLPETPKSYGRNVDDIVYLRRLLVTKTSGVKLLDFKKGSELRKTDIEDCLIPKVLINTLEEIFKDNTRFIEIHKKLTEESRIDYSSTHTNFRDQEVSFIDFGAKDDFNYFKDLIFKNEDKDIKVKIAHKYCELVEREPITDHYLKREIMNLFV